MALPIHAACRAASCFLVSILPLLVFTVLVLLIDGASTADAAGARDAFTRSTEPRDPRKISFVVNVTPLGKITHAESTGVINPSDSAELFSKSSDSILVSNRLPDAADGRQAADVANFLLTGGRAASFARKARRLIARNTWGVLSTISVHLRGAPFGNTVSFSDGPPGNFSGTPYFYLSPFDPSAADVASHPAASLAVSALPLGTCADVDPESPLCTKLTLTGRVVPVDGAAELSFGKEALFTRHPEMKTWPPNHHWRVLKLSVSDVFLMDGFGGARRITVDEYYAAEDADDDAAAADDDDAADVADAAGAAAGAVV